MLLELDGYTDLHVPFPPSGLHLPTKYLEKLKVQVMAPFTPFFVESMYQNLRKCAPAAPESVHYTSIPEPPSLQVRLPAMHCLALSPEDTSPFGPLCAAVLNCRNGHLQMGLRQEIEHLRLTEELLTRLLVIFLHLFF